jgi:cob(I)alamin adenosyltransferase
MSRRKLRLQKRVFALAAIVLSSIFSTGCEISRDHDPLENLTDEEIDRLEKEIKELPEDSVILKILNDYLESRYI